MAQPPNKSTPIIPSEMVDLVYTIRGERVMLDRDLAALFDVETRQINQQVKRNWSCYILMDTELRYISA